MPFRNNHIIQKQILEVEIDHFGDAFDFRNKLSNLYHEKLFPKFENIFSEICMPSDLIQTDKLEIDIGYIDYKNWEGELVEKTLRELKKKLVVLDKKKLPDKSEKAIEIFFYFLRYGNLPWNERLNSIEELELLIPFNKNFIYKLKQSIKQENQLKRLLYSFSENFCEKIIIELTADKRETLEKIFSSLDKLPFKPSRILIQSLLMKIFSAGKGDEENEFFLILSQNREDKIFTAGKESGEENEKEAAKTKSSEEFIYINNAGLVLLHPFLPELFRRLGFIEGKKWISPELKHQAVFILQYMLNSIENFEEFDLSLNKLLCGMETDEVLYPAEIISIEIKSACKELLGEIIRHWSILKNTSVNSLQKIFLQRNGKLSKVDNGWLLQVEQKVVDVLLGKLPWGVGIIKLPWMENILFVEWT